MDLALAYYSIQRFVYLKNTPSTNEYGANVSSINNPNYNYCVYTYNQTDGRGQIGRKWFSGQGENIACSFYYRINKLKVKDQFDINIAVCLALYDLIVQYLPNEKIHIKWPNDMYIENKKVAGILIQNQIKGYQISSTTIGIGINVNTQQFPEELPNPTSINHYAKNIHGINKLELLHQLSISLSEKLNQMTIRDMRSEYISRLYRINELHNFRSEEGEVFAGTIRGITQEGKISIDTEKGPQEFSFRQISYII